MKHRVSELFGPTIQGEGQRTGQLSIWVRTYGCNLECSGMFQEDPTDPSQYVLPYKDVDLTKITLLEDLPVFDYGCDSSYSWSSKYKHLAKDYSTEELADQLYKMLPNGKFKHPVTKSTYDLCITGGEPMLQQKQTVALVKHMIEKDAFPYDIEIETNGTKKLQPELEQLIKETTAAKAINEGISWWWSISPKLWNVAGEPADRAWKPEVIKQYWDANPNGWLKFVMTNNDAAWDELDRNVRVLRDMGVGFPVYIMPVGATKAQQEDSNVISALANRATQNGYHISGRLHAIIWGNTVGV